MLHHSFNGNPWIFGDDPECGWLFPDTTVSFDRSSPNQRNQEQTWRRWSGQMISNSFFNSYKETDLQRIRDRLNLTDWRTRKLWIVWDVDNLMLGWSKRSQGRPSFKERKHWKNQTINFRLRNWLILRWEWVFEWICGKQSPTNSDKHSFSLSENDSVT